MRGKKIPEDAPAERKQGKRQKVLKSQQDTAKCPSEKQEKKKKTRPEKKSTEPEKPDLQIEIRTRPKINR
jgi:hypothetical protein